MKWCAILFILTSQAAAAQLKTNVFWTSQTSMPAHEVIYYKPDVKLSWSDFKGEPNTTGIVAAITMSGFGYKADLKTLGNDGQLNVSVYCYFSKPKSWVKPDRKTQYILLHEQHHFDISYLAANIFMNKVRNASITVLNYNTVIPQLYRESLVLMNEMQERYDTETRNGQLKDMQAKWNALLDEKLLTIAQ